MENVEHRESNIEIENEPISNDNPIPKQLQRDDLRFIRLDKDSKKPTDVSWNVPNSTVQYRFNDKVLLDWLKDGGNYGVLCGYEGLVVIDVDTDGKELHDYIEEHFPKTLTIKTWSAETWKKHYYFRNKNTKLTNLETIDKEGKTTHYGEIRSFNLNTNTYTQVVAAGSHVIDAREGIEGDYRVISELNIVSIDDELLEELKKKFVSKEILRAERIKRDTIKFGDGDIENNLNLINLIDTSKLKEVRESYFVGSHPIHGSTTGTNFHVNCKRNTWYCFHGGSHGGGGIASWIAVKEGLIKCEEAVGKLDGETYKKVLKLAEIKYGFVPKSIEQSIRIEKTDKDYSIMTRRGQIEEFWKVQPFYYDVSKIFWLWDNLNCRWVISDEIDFCNSIFNVLHIDTIDSKTRLEIIEGFKRVGRLHKPKKVKMSWVQYLNKIYDVITGESFDATPEYFVTNPIPWKVGESEDTPTIDKYFDDWIKGQDASWKNTLYEILAYNTSSDKFMQRLIALCGGGCNGKGTYIKLNYRFLGEENYVSSEIKALSEDKFEPAVLYRKLLCVMGEVSYDDLRNTNILKKMGGEDKFSFQFKGKTPFTDDNTATGICLTNSMPITPDKTIGFYRKWLIVDFLNQFKISDKKLIDIIPAVEFENLAKKSLRILKELYNNPHFTNEGNIEERTRRYEERSNPVIKFVEERCEEKSGEMISLRNFTEHCNTYLKEKHLRILTSKQIGKILREDGLGLGNREVDGAYTVAILNLKLKNIENIQHQTRLYREETNPDLNINHINHISNTKEDERVKDVNNGT